VKNFYNRLKFNHIHVYQQLQQWLGSNLPCVLCDAPATAPNHTHLALCAHCIDLLPWYHAPRCPQCALPTASGALCGICLQHAPAFNHTLTPFRYAYPLDRLLHQFKYHQQLSLGHLLANSLLSPLSSLAENVRPEVMMAMPMHHNRVQARGFNHALELAKQVHQQWQIPLDIAGCTRVLDTPTQAGMDMKTRTRNLRGAFATHRSWQGQHVMVVDDVMTTGASMHAVAKVLKQAGASRVTALVLARTLKSDEP
jgi:ComF family protein